MKTWIDTRNILHGIHLKYAKGDCIAVDIVAVRNLLTLAIDAINCANARVEMLEKQLEEKSVEV